MKLKEFSLPLTLLVIAALLAGTSIYLNTRKKNALKESKSQLTAPKNPKNAPKFEKIKSLFHPLHQKPKNQNSTEPVLTLERFYTEAEIKSMTAQGFDELLLDVERRLPTLADIKSVPAGALHRTPETIMLAGKDLGLIKEVLNAHENYSDRALVFYDNCAKNDQRPTPIRALCLTNVVEMKKRFSMHINLKDYPAQVIDLAKMITDI